MARLDSRAKRGRRGADDYDKIFLHVYAPTLIEYLRWVLKTAQDQGMERLYFLARDSWLTYHMARRMVKKMGLKLEVRYIHLSRFSLRNAEYSFIGKGALETICVGGIDISFRKLMNRAKLTDEEALTVAKEIGFENRMDECLSYAQIQEVKAKLYSTDTIFEYIREHSEVAYILTEEYLREQGLCDDVRYAIVDSGWVGTTQMSLQRVLSRIIGKECELTGYYFGLYELPKDAKASQYHSYYLRPNEDFERKVRFSICLYETLMSSPNGMTLGYKSCEGRMTPVFNEIGNPNSSKMYRNRDLLMEYLRCFDFKLASSENDNSLLIEDLLKLSMGEPTEEEAKAMGTLQFCDDVLESQMQDVARSWNKKELCKQSFVLKIIFKFFNSKVKLHESGWPEGSIVNLCGEGVRSRIALFNERMYKWGMYYRKARLASE